MGDDAVILEGVESPLGPAAPYSTVHRAGRMMSRTEAAGKFRRGKAWTCGMRGCDGVAPMGTSSNADGSNPRCPKCGAKAHRRETRELVREGNVSREMLDAWIGPKEVNLRSGVLDEPPQAYRRLPDVLAAQGETVKVPAGASPKARRAAGTSRVARLVIPGNTRLMPRKPQSVPPSDASPRLIIEVEGYDGDDGEIVVNNYRSANSPPFGAPDKIYCIGEMEADGVIRFHDWGYATAQEAKDALRWLQPLAGQPDAPIIGENV